MITRANFKRQIMLILLMVCVSSQLSLRNKRQQDPSETDYFSPLDESLRLDHLPVHDDTELEKIENDISATPEGEIVHSTVANEIDGYIFDNEVEPTSSATQVNEKTNDIDYHYDYATDVYDFNDYSNKNQENTNFLPNSDNHSKDEISDENFSEHVSPTNEDEYADLNKTDDYEHYYEEYNYNKFFGTSESDLSYDLNSRENYQSSDYHIDDEENDVTNEILHENNSDEDQSLYLNEPNGDKLYKSNQIAEDYESEVEIKPKPSVWFKQAAVNNSHLEDSHLTANCPDLNCEFGFKTDLYGYPMCSCFNPCHEKKCGANICKIEKISESKFIGACYDPTKIERPIHCHLPLATGKCKNYTSRFYFNSFLQRCSHFVFTGCEGNHNNFESWEKCEMECNTCSLPAARGPCHGNIIRYYYDSLKRECVPFNWGGCKGNDNNFKSRKHCEDSCLFRKDGALFLHGMPIQVIRKYYSNQDHLEEKNSN